MKNKQVRKQNNFPNHLNPNNSDFCLHTHFFAGGCTVDLTKQNTESGLLPTALWVAVQKTTRCGDNKTLKGETLAEPRVPCDWKGH